MKKIINNIMFRLLGMAAMLSMTTGIIAAPKKLLVVKETWFGMILNGTKTWEIRGKTASNTLPPTFSK